MLYSISIPSSASLLGWRWVRRPHVVASVFHHLPAFGGGGWLQVSQTPSCCSISVPSSAICWGWRLTAGESYALILYHQCSIICQPVGVEVDCRWVRRPHVEASVFHHLPVCCGEDWLHVNQTSSCCSISVPSSSRLLGKVVDCRWLRCSYVAASVFHNLPACGGGGWLQVRQPSSCCSITVPLSASLWGWLDDICLLFNLTIDLCSYLL